MAKKSAEADAAYAEALKRIEVCRKERRNKLDLSRLGLRKLPLEVGQLTTLTELYLLYNQLTALPREIGQLTALTTLYLTGNHFTELPLELLQFTALRELHLLNNQLTMLPAEIGQLTALTRLSLARNKLRALPTVIGEFTALTELYLDRNHLRTLPPEVGHLRALTTLYLDKNQLTSLPSEIGQLTALKECYLHDNPRLGIPDSVLGPRYEEVHASDDQKRKSPARPSDILNFYFSREKGAIAGTLESVGEIKVMLVGRGGAGKTSLRRFFLGDPHNKDEKETPGIALDSFPLACLGTEIIVRLWDFAGQEITHALHQFFLTEGCVYILVLDPRSNTEMTDAFYWLNLLKRYAGRSPVVVAMNRQDARSGGYDVDRHLLRERFPHIQSFIPTNCETRIGCAELQAALLAAIETLNPNEPPRLLVPEAWLQVKQECFERGQGHASASQQGQPPRKHLTLDEFRQICRDQGETDPEKQESLARLLHRLGAVLHFVEDPRLRDTSVLDPHWVSDGVYRMLRYKDHPNSDGILNQDDMLKALPDENEVSARFLLRLMERFEMCFPLDEGEDGKPATRWLIPGALNQYQPAGVGPEWQQPGSVRLRYVYDPLPEGVLPRFIVMTHLLGEGKPRWRNGVVLQEGQAKALVRRGEKVNQVEVIALGPDAERLRLLQIIQGNMDRINAEVPDPKPVLEQELNGLPGTYRRISELEAAETAKTSVVVEPAQGGQALVEPTPQLNRISESASRGPGRVPLNAFLSYSHADKRTKDIFLVNLNVMMKKKFITSWHDGLIEPGMRWREEIEEKLETMDIFVGLLTNNFVASDFIQTVELNEARKKLQEQRKDFLFVLILVDDIGLEGLDLAEYQLLIPGGKAVSKHKSRKEGFNEAQKELEKLIVKRQEAKQTERAERPAFVASARTEIKEAGITFIVQGDVVHGGKHMSEKNYRITGDVSGIVGDGSTQTITNSFNHCANPAAAESELAALKNLLAGLMANLPEDKKEEVEVYAEDLEKSATSTDLKAKKKFSLSARSLLEAAKWVKDFTGNIGGTLLNLGKAIWPGFQLPETSKSRPGMIPDK